MKRRPANPELVAKLKALTPAQLLAYVDERLRREIASESGTKEAGRC